MEVVYKNYRVHFTDFTTDIQQLQNYICIPVYQHLWFISCAIINSTVLKLCKRQCAKS